MQQNEISIRTELRPGDIGYITYMHGKLYGDEYSYGVAFEAYVAAGLYEFYRQYDPLLDRAWVAEHGDRVVGFLLLMHREENQAQLRYFILEPAYRGMGLGKRLMELFMEHMSGVGYGGAYLWTTHELGTAASLYKRHGFVLVEEKASDAFGKPLYEQKYEWRETK